MVRGICRDVFAPMLLLSGLIHAGLLAWLGQATDAGSEVIAPKRGRFAIHLHASVAALPDRPEPKRDAPPEPPAPPPPREPPSPTLDRHKLPQLAEETLSPVKDWLVAVAEPARRMATLIAAAPDDERPGQRAPTPPPQPAERPDVAEPAEFVPAAPPRPSAVGQPAQSSPGSTASEGADVEEMPRIVSNPAPRYPADALTAGIQGTVVLRVRIGADGKVLSAAIHRASGVASLDEAALAAVRRWQFVPARRRGGAVAKEVAVPVRFTIRGR